jgi:hypothetical protein
MHDDNRAELARLVRRLDQVALHLATAAGVADVLALHPRIVFGDDCRLRGICRQQRRDRGRRRT